MDSEKHLFERPLSRQAQITLSITMLLLHSIVTLVTVRYFSSEVGMSMIEAIRAEFIILSIPIGMALWMRFIPSYRMKGIPNKFTWGYVFTATVLILGQIGIIIS